MKLLRSYVAGGWHEPTTGFVPLIDPCSEEPIAQASSAGIDFGAALAFARDAGRRALAGTSIARRAAWLAAASQALFARRDELIELSLRNTGATRKDAKFDIDGATGVLAYYAQLGAELGERRWFPDGDGVQLGRSPRFWGQHVGLPLAGVAVHVNAFNFPAWGFAEKAACAWLAGMPVISKPASSSALVTQRCVELLVEAAVLPPGLLQLVCGSAGDLLERLGGQDVLAFTGSASTALQLRAKTALLRASTRVNVEADSLNAALVAPDAAPGSETWGAFVRDVEREITQKTGQKCTAVRRVFVPRERLAALREELAERLAAVVTGNPLDPSVTMGPLATAQQLVDVTAGTALLQRATRRIVGSGARVDGVGNPSGKGYFFAPTLLEADDAAAAAVVHEHEVFGPVCTLLAYDGSAEQGAALVALAGGSLVSSLYSDDREFVERFVAAGGAHCGRLYLGSEKVAGQLPGSGVALPQVLHGGPGRAGGGQELGGTRGLALYLQRVGLTGDRALVEKLAATEAPTPAS
ncbi:MAG TPA: 3,4-dehydroadipyl-CoA semialdehyde dehydrogenase [Candidatus Polarisedimenticolaceae bacterium]|nr:3,4-dehydroadipyl-CoA semialdehyde dehydrogenase [Candidatus Polarisedimenticolaceae bacterium]